MYRVVVICIGKVLLIITRWRGGGSALPGLVVETIAPRFLDRSSRHFRETILVAGTNGKTTTAKMIRSMLDADGRRVVANTVGSNMPRGIISAILQHMDWRGRLQADMGLFEIDEGFIEGVAEALQPRSIVVLNLLRDQLDRYGELNRTAQLIANALPYTETAILNTDDPRVAELEEHARRAIFFGAGEYIRSRVPHDDALYQAGSSHTPGARPEPIVRVQTADRTDSGQRVMMRVGEDTWTVDLQVAGVFNAYNAAAAAALAYVLEIPRDTATAALASVEPAFGRSERIRIGNKCITLLLVKNPSGFNQIIDTYLMENHDIPTLIAINDNYADGRDVSWLWDVSIERLSDTGRYFLTGGVRGYDMALRLQYAEIGSVPELEASDAIDSLLERVPDGSEGYIVPTYTAMLHMRKLLLKYAASSEEKK